MDKDAELSALWKAVHGLYVRVERLEEDLKRSPAAGAGPSAPGDLAAEPLSPAPAAPTPPPLPVPPPQMPPPLQTFPPARLSPIVPLSPQPAPAPHRGRSIEAIIGQNWTGWVGGIVFVLGVLFFFKYAWDQGWVNITPAMRVMAAIATGIIISMIGERMHRSALRALAATLHGTGLAVVMSSFFAAFALFPADQRVLSAPAAFAGVALTAAVGIFLALHIDAIVIALIAFLGAYLAPIVLHTGADQSAALLSYLGVLAVAGCALSHWRPRWSALRALSWAGTFILFTLWHNDRFFVAAHPVLAWTALGCYFACYLLEMVLTLRRHAAMDPTLHAPAAILSVLNSAVVFYLVGSLYHGADHSHFLGVVAIVLAGVQALAGVVSRSRPFALASLLQTSALLTLCIPLLLDQYSITLAWLAMAMVLAAVAWQLNIPAARGWAMLVLLLVIGRLFGFDDSSRRAIVFSIGSLVISRWAMMAIGAAVLTEVIAWMRPGGPVLFPMAEQRLAQLLPARPRLSVPAAARVLNYATPAQRGPISVDSFGVVLSIIGTALYLLASATVFDGAGITLAWGLWAGGFVLLASLGRRLAYFAHAAGLLVLAALRWGFMDELQPMLLGWRSTSAAPLIDLPCLVGVLIIAALAGLLAQLRRSGDGSHPSLRRMVEGALAGTILALLNFQTLHAVDWFCANVAPLANPAMARQVALSILWAVCGFVAVVVGFRRKLASLRYAALLLLGITLLKILLIDMADVRAVWRILSFIAVGGLLLGVSYIYHKQTESRQTSAA
jgi:uncharacterized membrane protein